MPRSRGGVQTARAQPGKQGLKHVFQDLNIAFDIHSMTTGGAALKMQLQQCCARAAQVGWTGVGIAAQTNSPIRGQDTAGAQLIAQIQTAAAPGLLVKPDLQAPAPWRHAVQWHGPGAAGIKRARDSTAARSPAGQAAALTRLPPLAVWSRLTVDIQEPGHVAQLQSMPQVTQAYDLVAAVPHDTSTAVALAHAGGIDILCLRPEYAVKVSSGLVKALAKSGIAVEVCAARMLASAAQRRAVIMQVIELTRAARGTVPVLVSSGAQTALHVRSPADLAVMFAGSGLAPPAVLASASQTPALVLEHARRRMTTAGVVKSTIPLASLPEVLCPPARASKAASTSSSPTASTGAQATIPGMAVVRAQRGWYPVAATMRLPTQALLTADLAAAPGSEKEQVDAGREPSDVDSLGDSDDSDGSGNLLMPAQDEAAPASSGAADGGLGFVM